jgi:cytochrome P450
MVNYWASHRDPRFWREPERFDPGRWLDGATDAPPFVYLPFGGGRRECPARSLATMQVVLSLATLARSWAPRPLGGTVRVGFVPFVRPRGGLPARLEPRAAP